jgi:hypothetical protein
MYKNNGKDRILIKTSQLGEHLAIGYTLGPKSEEEAPKKKTYIAKAKEEKSDSTSGDS